MNINESFNKTLLLRSLLLYFIKNLKNLLNLYIEGIIFGFKSIDNDLKLIAHTSRNKHRVAIIEVDIRLFIAIRA